MLKLKVASLEDVPESARGLYTKTEGGFKLDVEGADDIDRLQSTLTKERDARKEAERKSKEKDKMFSGIDLDEARDALKLKQDLEDKKLIDEGDVEGLVEKRIKQHIAEHQSQTESLAKERDALKGQLHELLIKTSVTEAATTLRSPKPNALNMIVGEFEKLFRIDEKGKVIAKNADGEVMYGADGVTPLSIKEQMEGFVSTHDYLFEPSTGGGSNEGGQGGGGGKNFSQQDTSKMSGSARINAARAADSKSA